MFFYNKVLRSALKSRVCSTMFLICEKNFFSVRVDCAKVDCGAASVIFYARASERAAYLLRVIRVLSVYLSAMSYDYWIFREDWENQVLIGATLREEEEARGKVGLLGNINRYWFEISYPLLRREKYVQMYIVEF